MARNTMLAGMPNKKKPTAKTDEEILQGLSAKEKQLPFDMEEPKDGAAGGLPAKHPRIGQNLRMSIVIPKELHRRFEMHAVEIDASMNDLVIDAITVYMANVKK